MDRVKLTVFTVIAILFILSANIVFAEDGTSNKKSDVTFGTLDKDHDGKISKDEWNAVDTNKDNQITRDEWQKYDFKSEDVKWFDNNGDVLMDEDEFLNNRE
jgi:Ca2+-binding EF-hand superfamily protein